MPPSLLGYRRGTEKTLNQRPPDKLPPPEGRLSWTFNCVVQALQKAKSLPKDPPDDALQQIALELNAIRLSGRERTAKDVRDKLTEVQKLYQAIQPILDKDPDYDATNGTTMTSAAWKELVAQNAACSVFKDGWPLLPYVEELYSSHHPHPPPTSEVISTNSSVLSPRSVASPDPNAVGSVISRKAGSFMIQSAAESASVSFSTNSSPSTPSVDSPDPNAVGSVISLKDGSFMIQSATESARVPFSTNSSPSTPPRNQSAAASEVAFSFPTPMRAALGSYVNLLKNATHVEMTPRSRALVDVIAAAGASPPVACGKGKSTGKTKQKLQSLSSSSTVLSANDNQVPFDIDDAASLITHTVGRSNWDDRFEDTINTLLRGIEAGTANQWAERFPMPDGQIGSVIDFVHAKLIFTKDIGTEPLARHAHTLRTITEATNGWRVVEHIVLTIERIQHSLAFESNIRNQEKNKFNMQLFLLDPQHEKELDKIGVTAAHGDLTEEQHSAIQDSEAWTRFSNRREDETSKLRFLSALYGLVSIRNEVSSTLTVLFQFGSMVLLLPTLEPTALARPKVKMYQERLHKITSLIKRDRKLLERLTHNEEVARQNILHIVAAVAPPPDNVVKEYLNTFWKINPCTYGFAK
ncbi:hypothetical protein DFH07DRAFT_784543 [Mycena maculata]|uniref:Uncharacterized protein n=1 Tax=Mycena maculata TaxID=230809 RepID=A0AAD7HGV5_9AGAR|nr:hypothetical protein DFH07DRAFT_784543 [Mycena maculata]